MARWQRVAACVLSALASAASDVAAQTTVLVRTAYFPPFGCSDTGCPTAVFAYDPDTRGLRGSTPGTAGSGAYLTPDGALLVAFDEFNPRLIVLDRTTGIEFTIALPSTVGGMIGNPVRTEVYVNDATGGLAMAPTGVRRLSTPACSSPTAMAVSADGRRVVYRCFPGGGNPGYSAVVETASGALVSMAPYGWSPVLNADGSVLFQAESTPTGMLLRRYLADSATLDVETLLAQFFTTPTMAFDPRSRRLFVQATSPSGMFDDVTLERLPLWGCASNVTAMVFDRDRPRAFLVGFNSYEPFSVDDGVFCEIDTTSGGLTVSHRYVKPRSGTQAVALAEAPRPPVALASHVAGTSVSLTWQPGGPPAAIRRYVLEVGSASGLNDIFSGLDVGLQPSFAASSAPPGTYYVRVRAGNYSGLSAPSNEVVVQVP